MLILYVLDVHEETPSKDSSVRGSNPGWKDTFSIDVKVGEIHRCMIEIYMLGEREKRHVYRGAMVTGGT